MCYYFEGFACDPDVSWIPLITDDPIWNVYGGGNYLSACWGIGVVFWCGDNPGWWGLDGTS